MSTWEEKAKHSKVAAEQARAAIQAAGERRRNAMTELAEARDALANLCDEIAQSGLLPKAQIADLAGISRSRLYTQ